MNVIKENLESQVELIKVVIEPADYAQVVGDALKNYKKKANIPGFRPGMVPMNLVKKMYYKNVLAEESYRLASSEVYKYIQDNKLDIIADPMPSDTQPTSEFNEGDTLEFHYKVAVINPFTIDLPAVSLDKYVIEITDDLREGYTNNLLNRFGQLVDVEEITKDEAVSATLVQDGMTIEEAYVGLISMSDEERAPFIGKRVGFEMEVNVNELYKTPSQRASILGVKEEELESINPIFNLAITRIRKFALPTMDAEFFAQAFPAGDVTSEEQLNAFVDGQLRKDLDKECYYKFVMDSREILVEKSGVALPEAFLKEWLFAINEGKFTAEEIDKEFPQFVKMMVWDVVKKKYVVEGEIKVEKEDLLEEAKATAAAQFAQYGMPNVEESMLENYANQILSNKEEQRRIFDSLLDMKVIDYVTANATIVEKNVTMDEFRVAVSK